MKTVSKVMCGIGVAAVAGVLALVMPAQQSVAASPDEYVEPGFRVHEWGTFTVVPDSRGLPLSWYNPDGPEELPKFVYAGKPGFPGKNVFAQVRMETPVLYFYTDKKLNATIDVDFPGGQVTEWYPHGGRLKQVSPNGRTTLGSFRWADVILDPDKKITPPKASDDNHYFEARGVDSVPVRLRTGDGKWEEEEFIFYRGVRSASFDSLHAKVDRDVVTLAPNGRYAPNKVIVFENRDGKTYWQEEPLHGGFNTVSRQALPLMERLPEAELRNWITEEGLTGKEAEAMIATWRKSWFEPGLRVFHMLPQGLVDELLPLTVTPKPEKLARAFVTRTDLLTSESLDRLEKIVMTKSMKDAWAFAERDHGRFAFAAVTSVASRKHADKDLQKKAGQIIANQIMKGQLALTMALAGTAKPAPVAVTKE